MNDFKIRRGLYSQLFNEDGDLRREEVVLELGCWYLCTDEAWLYVCVEDENGQLDLKQINRAMSSVDRPVTSPDEGNTEPARSIIDAFINDETGKLHLVFSDDTEEILGPIVGKDGLVTVIKVGEVEYQHKNGRIELPSFAKQVPFTTPKYVTNPLGTFEFGEDISGLTVEALFSRLLGLTDIIPETPQEPETVIDTIIFNKLPMYQVGAEGALVEVPYVYYEFTPEKASTVPDQAGFYQITDGGNVIESGYQQFTSYENEMFYMVALPDLIKFNSDTMQVSVQIWDNGNKKWVATTPDLTTQLTCDLEAIQAVFDECGIQLPEVIDGYTLWVNLENTNNGEKFRYIIKEVIS